MNKNISPELERVSVILSSFEISGRPVYAEPIIAGHINSTYAVECGDGEKYVLQKINTAVFKDVDGLMNNVTGVTEHIKKKIAESGADPSGRTLNFHPAKNGKYYHVTPDGSVFRLYDYIDGVTSYQHAEDPRIFYNCAKAFGDFQRMLSDYPADKLSETIPHFHDTVKRFDDLKTAIANDAAGRRTQVGREIEFAFSCEDICPYVTSRLANGTYKLRVTHNDTKLSNILVDNDSLEGVCVIDLDTVMPGSVLYDFGDSIRSGACSTAEDERDESRVSLNINAFRQFTKGFLDGTGGSLSKDEILGLPYGALVITFETGMRFLEDYLNGDVYFSVHREGQNLDRARTQFALAADMKKHMDEMTDIVMKCGNI